MTTLTPETEKNVLTRALAIDARRFKNRLRLESTSKKGIGLRLGMVDQRGAHRCCRSSECLAGNALPR